MRSIFPGAGWLMLMAAQGCCLPGDAGKFERPSPLRDYEFSYTDEPVERRLKLTFVSKSKRQICVGRETWPGPTGLMAGGEDSNGIYLVVGQKIYAFHENDYWGYCREKRCYNPVDQGGKVVGYVKYSGFGLPEDSDSLPKDLKYHPEPFFSDQTRFVE